MRTLVKLTAISGLSSVVNMLLVLARAKILAVALGAAGVGLLAQINNLATMLSAVASVGIGYGITNQVARYTTEKDTESTTASLSDAVRSAGMLLLGASTAVILALFLFADGLSGLLLGDNRLWYLLLILAIGLPFKFYAFLCESILQGYRQISVIARARVWSALLGLAAVVPLAWFFDLTGAVIGISIWSLFTLILYGRALRQTDKAFATLWRQGHFRWRQAKIVLQFGSATLLTSALSASVLLLLRTQVVIQLGAAANGIYQVVWTVSSQYLILVSLSLWSYAYPQLVTVMANHKQAQDSLNQTLRLGLLLIGPMIFTVIATRYLFVRLLYTSEFLPAADLMLVQLWGDLARLLIWWVELPLYAQGRMRWIIFIESVWGLSYLGVATVMLPVHGLVGISLSYTLVSVCIAMGVLLLQQIRTRFSLTVNNGWLLLKVIILLAVSMVLPGQLNGWLLLAPILLLGWLAWTLHSTERAAIFALIQQTYHRGAEHFAG
jgi:O-antigen/teichoic acid export membrane protein